MLELRQVHKTFVTPQGPLKVLEDVSLRLAAGQSLALMGESGSGKSTLLHLAAVLDLPDQGVITLGGQNVESLPEPTRAKLRREQLGLVFQQFHLVPSLTVIDNLRLQARLAIGRALAPRPPLLLAGSGVLCRAARLNMLELCQMQA